MTQSAGNIPPPPSKAPLLFGGSGPNTPLPPSIGKAIVAPSGRSLVLLAEDGTGALTGVTAINPASEVQSVTPAGTPAGGHFTLSFGGATSAPIGVTSQSPPSYAMFTFPTVAGHSYDLAFSHPYCFADAITCEAIRGGVVVASRTVPAGVHLPDPSDPGSFVDSTSQAGNPVGWSHLASGVVASDTSMSLRISGNGPVFFDAARVADTTAGGAPAYYKCTDASTCSFVPNDGSWSLTPDPNECLSGSFARAYCSGEGEFYFVAGGAPALQSALEALPTIGLGNVTVADATPRGGSGAYRVTFAGALAGPARPLLASSDPAVVVAEAIRGGNAPTISINGGPPTLLTDWVWADASTLPYAIAPLPQSAPASEVYPVFALPCVQSGYWDRTFVDDASVSGATLAGFSPGLSLRFPFQELPAGTYQVAVTYSTASIANFGVTYTPHVATQFLVLDGTGKTLATVAVDQTKAPNDLTSGGHGWKAIGTFTLASRGSLTLEMTTAGVPAQSGATQPVAVLDAALLTRTSADASIVIKPTDSVSVAVPAGWMTTQAGAIPAATLVATRDPILPPFVSGPKTMKAGYNVEPATYGCTFVTHSNLAYLIDTLGTSQDANGWPTRMQGQDAWNNKVISGGYIAGGDLFQTSAVINTGLFSMAWAGDPTIELVSDDGYTTVVDVTTSHPRPANLAGNWRVYSITCDPAGSAAPKLRLHIHSDAPDPADPSGQSYIVNLKNLAIYPPDPSDPTGRTIWGLDPKTNTFTAPPTFHPWFLEKLAGMQCLRFLDPLQTNFNPAASPAHYKTTAHANRCSPTVARKSVGVASIKAPPAGGNYFAPNNGTVLLQVTTTAPHGYFEGCTVNFSSCGTAQFAGGSLVLDSPTTGIYGVVHVLDPTNLVISTVGGNGSAIANTLAGGSLVAPNFGAFWPLQDVAELVTEVGCTDLWFNMPPTVDTSPGGGAYQIAAFLASATKPGVKVHVEYGNECWNYFTMAYVFCSLQNDRLSGGHDGAYQTFYANQAKATHDQCLAAFQAAGRANDLVRVFGGVAGQPSYSDAVLGQARKIGAVVDEVCIAVYFSNSPYAGYTAQQQPIYNAMTVDQLLDHFELSILYGQYAPNQISNQVPVLQAHGYGSAKVVAYEGGLTVCVPIDPPGSQPPGTTPNFFTRQLAVRRHPRIYGITLQFAQANQDAGLALWNYFNIGGGSNEFCWDTYENGRQARGTGDPVADAVNITDYRVRSKILCEVGGAWNHWASLVAPTQPRGGPHRNGNPGIKGLRGGMARPLRAR